MSGSRSSEGRDGGGEEELVYTPGATEESRGRGDQGQAGVIARRAWGAAEKCGGRGAIESRTGVTQLGGSSEATWKVCGRGGGAKPGRRRKPGLGVQAWPWGAAGRPLRPCPSATFCPLASTC